MSSSGTHRLSLALYAAAWRGLDRLRHRRGSAASQRPSKVLGEAGEREAYLYLRRAGYTVVARQWRAPNLNGELDLIAWQGDTLCIVEVKSRSASDRYAPGYRMNPRKCDMLRRMARAYVHGLPWPDENFTPPRMRFDLIAALFQDGVWTLEHRQAVFDADG